MTPADIERAIYYATKSQEFNPARWAYSVTNGEFNETARKATRREWNMDLSMHEIHVYGVKLIKDGRFAEDDQYRRSG